MKEKFNQLLDKYQKTASDSSSKTLKLMKLKIFKSTVEEFKKTEDQKELHDFLLHPRDDSDNKLVSEVLFRVIFKNEFNKISDKMSHKDFVKYHDNHPSTTSLDYFFEVATTETEAMGKTNNIDIINDEI